MSNKETMSDEPDWIIWITTRIIVGSLVLLSLYFWLMSVADIEPAPAPVPITTEVTTDVVEPAPAPVPPVPINTVI